MFALDGLSVCVTVFSSFPGENLLYTADRHSVLYPAPNNLDIFWVRANDVLWDRSS